MTPMMKPLVTIEMIENCDKQIEDFTQRIAAQEAIITEHDEKLKRVCGQRSELVTRGAALEGLRVSAELDLKQAKNQASLAKPDSPAAAANAERVRELEQTAQAALEDVCQFEQQRKEDEKELAAQEEAYNQAITSARKAKEALEIQRSELQSLRQTMREDLGKIRYHDDTATLRAEREELARITEQQELQQGKVRAAEQKLLKDLKDFPELRQRAEAGHDLVETVRPEDDATLRIMRAYLHWLNSWADDGKDFKRDLFFRETWTNLHQAVSLSASEVSRIVEQAQLTPKGREYIQHMLTLGPKRSQTIELIRWLEQHRA